MTIAIWWIRRDLRLADNPALTAAVDVAAEVIPLFIVDPKLVNSPFSSDKRLAFLWNGLRQLDVNLHLKCSQLVLREGDPLEILTQLISQTGAEIISAEADFTPYARKRDRRIRKSLPLQLVGSPGLRHPQDVRKHDGSPYIVFSPYMRAWRNLSLPSLGNILPEPEKIEPLKNIYPGVIPVIEQSSTLIFPSGEVHALDYLSTFLEGDQPQIFCYNERRDRVDLEGTSQLSPYFRFGMISARQAIFRTLAAISKANDVLERESAEGWLNELIWRDFFISILYHFPYVLKRNFKTDWNEISWINDEEEFHAWCHGRTGYPIVDAAMRQLLSIGWIHNRVRMITASFLVKDLLIDWKWGQQWFMQHLVDGDPAENNGGWQWVAGTGTDAAPYFRIFNPLLQSRKCDPHGNYIRRWIPELERVPDNYIHEPWKMPKYLQKKFDCEIGNDYPEPIVDHSWARDRALDIYKSALLRSHP